jgi:fumarate reductase flavoprotein subunit
VDTVAGATVSSAAMLEAVTKALESAGADIEALKSYVGNETETGDVEDLEYDVVVVGAGGAGMTAAIEVAEAGYSVIIVEKMPIIGGNTNRATGGMNAAETIYQEAAGVEDSKETFFADTMKGGYEKNDPELLQTMVDNAPSAVEWLNGLGANLVRISVSGGATNPRVHTPEDGSPVGPVVVSTLKNKIDDLGVEILLNTTAEKLIEQEGTVKGIEVVNADGATFNINTKAVIMATGGFGADNDLVAGFRPDLKGFSTTNHQGATGDGITMAQVVGAALTDIEEIQIHPTTEPGSGYMFTEGLRGDGAILVNKEGVRFTHELLTRDVVSRNILAQTDGVAYLITNQAMRETNATLDGYIKKGYAVEGDTIESLAENLGIDAETLEATLERYSAFVEADKDEDFERDIMKQTLSEGPYYAFSVTPGVHHTMGGLKINTKTEVIDTEGNTIPGLYAAGEVTGGIHGANRIGGNAVTDIIVFGRIAGQSVIELLSK